MSVHGLRASPGHGSSAMAATPLQQSAALHTVFAKISSRKQHIATPSAVMLAQQQRQMELLQQRAARPTQVVSAPPSTVPSAADSTAVPAAVGGDEDDELIIEMDEDDDLDIGNDDQDPASNDPDVTMHDVPPAPHMPTESKVASVSVPVAASTYAVTATEVVDDSVALDALLTDDPASLAPDAECTTVSLEPISASCDDNSAAASTLSVSSVVVSAIESQSQPQPQSADSPQPQADSPSQIPSQPSESTTPSTIIQASIPAVWNVWSTTITPTAATTNLMVTKRPKPSVSLTAGSSKAALAAVSSATNAIRLFTNHLAPTANVHARKQMLQTALMQAAMARGRSTPTATSSVPPSKPLGQAHPAHAAATGAGAATAAIASSVVLVSRPHPLLHAQPVGDADAEAADAFRMALAADVHESDLEEDEEVEHEHVEGDDDDPDEDEEEAALGLGSQRSRLRRFVDAEAEEGDEDSDEEDAMHNEEGTGDETTVQDKLTKSTRGRQAGDTVQADPAHPEVRCCSDVWCGGGGRRKRNERCVCGVLDGKDSVCTIRVPKSIASSKMCVFSVLADPRN